MSSRDHSSSSLFGVPLFSSEKKSELRISHDCANNVYSTTENKTLDDRLMRDMSVIVMDAIDCIEMKRPFQTSALDLILKYVSKDSKRRLHKLGFSLVTLLKSLLSTQQVKSFLNMSNESSDYSPEPLFTTNPVKEEVEENPECLPRPPSATATVKEGEMIKDMSALSKPMESDEVEKKEIKKEPVEEETDTSSQLLPRLFDSVQATVDSVSTAQFVGYSAEALPPSGEKNPKEEVKEDPSTDAARSNEQIAASPVESPLAAAVAKYLAHKRIRGEIPDGPVQLKCDFCDSRHTKGAEMEDHVRSMHPNESERHGQIQSRKRSSSPWRMAKCNFCDAIRKVGTSMNKHVWDVHPEECERPPPIMAKCMYCCVIRKRGRSMEKHVRDVHPNEWESYKQLLPVGASTSLQATLIGPTRPLTPPPALMRMPDPVTQAASKPQLF